LEAAIMGNLAAGLVVRRLGTATASRDELAAAVVTWSENAHNSPGDGT